MNLVCSNFLKSYRISVGNPLWNAIRYDISRLQLHAVTSTKLFFISHGTFTITIIQIVLEFANCKHIGMLLICMFPFQNESIVSIRWPSTCISSPWSSRKTRKGWYARESRKTRKRWYSRKSRESRKKWQCRKSETKWSRRKEWSTGNPR